MLKFWKKESTKAIHDPKIVSEWITIMKIPVFDGTQNLKEFLIQLHKEVRHMPEQQQFNILCMRLHGDAATKIAEYFKKDFQPTLAETLNILQQLYPETEKLKMSKISYPVQQQHQSILDFSKQIRKTINRMHPNKDGHSPKSRERLMIDAFISGTHPDLRQHLQHDQESHQSFAEIVQAANSRKRDIHSHNNNSKHKPQQRQNATPN